MPNKRNHKLIINPVFTSCIFVVQLISMSLVKLTVEIKSYWIAKRFNTIYLEALTKDNLIFNNQLIEEKNTRIKVHFSSEDRETFLSELHTRNKSWLVTFEVDPLTSSTARDKDGNKLTVFKAENANHHC